MTAPESNRGPVEIELDKLGIRYRGKVGVADISLVLRPGLALIVGPNGSGKTTLFRGLVGEQRLSSGRILINGEPVTAAYLRDHSGYVPQVDTLAPSLSVGETVDYAAWLGTAKKDQRRPVAIAALSVVNLTDKRDVRVRHLSGGMRRRLQMACVLTGSPEFMILDEPATGLDIEERARLIDAVSQVARDIPVLVSSHHGAEWAVAAQSVVVLREGALTFRGSSATFLAGPEHMSTPLDFDDAYSSWHAQGPAC